MIGRASDANQLTKVSQHASH